MSGLLLGTVLSVCTCWFHMVTLHPWLVSTLLLLLLLLLVEAGYLSRYSDSLRAGRSGNRIPVGARFSASVQTGPGAHPASYTKGTGSFPGVKQSVRGVDHPPPSSAEVKERVQLFLYSTSGPSWPVIGRPLPLPLSIKVNGEDKYLLGFSWLRSMFLLFLLYTADGSLKRRH